MFPVRGIVAVYVFAIGLYGAAMSLADEKRGLFRAIPYGRRIMCRLAAMAAPSALAALSGLAALWAGKCLGAWPKEVAAMAGYVAAVTLFSWGVRAVCRHEAVACCLIPFFWWAASCFARYFSTSAVISRNLAFRKSCSFRDIISGRRPAFSCHKKVLHRQDFFNNV